MDFLSLLVLGGFFKILLKLERTLEKTWKNC